jgi:hypothetical protein
VQPKGAVKKKLPFKSHATTPSKSNAATPRHGPQGGKPAQVPAKPAVPRQAPREATIVHVGLGQAVAPHARAPAAKRARVEIQQSVVAEGEARQRAKDWGCRRVDPRSCSLGKQETENPDRRESSATTDSGETVTPASGQPPAARSVPSATSGGPAEVSTRGTPANAEDLAPMQPEPAHPSAAIVTIDDVAPDEVAVSAVSARQALGPAITAAIYRENHRFTNHEQRFY